MHNFQLDLEGFLRYFAGKLRFSRNFDVFKKIYVVAPIEALLRAYNSWRRL